MKNICKIGSCLLLGIFMSACVKDGFDSENCPGDFYVNIQWPEVPDAASGSQITITRPDGTTVTFDIEELAGFNTGLDVGENIVTGHTGYKKDQVEIKGDVVSVIPNPDGSFGSPGDNFMGGSTSITVKPDGTTDSDMHLPMNRQTRPLVIRVKFEGFGANALASVNGTVEGIAYSRKLNHGFPPVDGQARHAAITSGPVGYAFAQGNDQFYSDSNLLLGIDGDKAQEFTLNVAGASGIPMAYTFDITGDMDEFHVTDVTEPWVIEIVLHLGADFNVTIKDWKVGPESWLEAQ